MLPKQKKYSKSPCKDTAHSTKEQWTEEQFFERLASIGFAYPPDSPPDRFARAYLRSLSR
jgi:hypothetical protein